MNKPLVSIIVPAYNVEKYISQCVDSLLLQTYKNIEIIVIDDGSTDKTHKILEQYKDVDTLKIISIKNSGVSQARNLGIDQSNGEYLMFVDGDDYVAPDFVEFFVFLISETKADFCVSENCFTKINDSVNDEKRCFNIISSSDAVALLLSPQIIVGCWNKIYSASFIKQNHIVFDCNLFYGEGLKFIIECSNKASKICVGKRKCYYYRKNNESSATSNFNLNRMINGEKSLLQISSIIDLDDKKIRDQFLLHITTFYISAMSRMIAYHEKTKHKELYKQWKSLVKNNLNILIRSKYIGFYRKLLVFSGVFFPHIISLLDTSRRKRIQKQSI